MVRTITSGLGLLAFAAAIVIGALAVTGVIGGAARSFRVGGSEVDNVPAANQFKPKSEHIDKTLTAGSLTWSVDTARRTTEIQSFTFPPRLLRGNLIVVTFIVKNDSDGPLTLDPESLVLVDKTGRESPPAASVNAEYVVPRYAILFNERALLDPGEEEKGKVIYDLGGPFGGNPRADLSGLRLRLGDGDPTVKEEKYLDLSL